MSRARKTTNYSVQVEQAEVAHLRDLAETCQHPSAASVVRALITGARTMFELPGFMRDRLERDMRERQLTPLRYFQETLALRYEELVRSDGRAGGRRASDAAASGRASDAAASGRASGGTR